MSEEERDNTGRNPFSGSYPAATKHTGAYQDIPQPIVVKRRPDEPWDAYEARVDASLAREPRPRTKKGGVCEAFPDLCKTPPAPPVIIPYPNVGELKDAVGVSYTVLAENKPVVIASSEIPTSRDDEPGTLGGVISGVNMGKVRFLQWSSRVLCGGEGVVYLGCKTTQNSNNIIGKVSEPSQTKVWVGP